VCHKQRSEFAASLDVVERAVVAFALRTQARIRVVFAIESADRQQAEATVVATRNGESSSFIVIRSAISNASATDWRRARLRITSFHSTPAATGRSRTDKARARAVTTGSDQWSHVTRKVTGGMGGQISRDPRPADRRAVACTHPRNNIFDFVT
jgi:hypothetical protein